MQIMDMLRQMGRIQSVARELGVSESQAATGAAALIPAILGGFKKQAQAQTEPDLAARPRPRRQSAGRHPRHANKLIR